MIKTFNEFLESEKKKKTYIISAFPGCGKTTFFKENPNLSLSDSDSMYFSWIHNDEGKVRNSEFPNNYIEHIKSLIGTHDFIFVSSHKEVREALKNEKILFNLVYPNKSMREDFFKRYKERGNDEAFLNLLDANWDTWIEDIEKEPEIGLRKFELNEDHPYLKDIIDLNYNSLLYMQ
jgi:hypothetical protein